MTNSDLKVIIRELLAVMFHSEGQRNAFMAGFKNEPLPPHSSEKARMDFRLGQRVREALK
ncbi:MULTISPECIES: hypothetical protein [unclassified Sphingobium]|uniref:hypothetical protein n=1 Tax=unclassified Sphingobium TaxID=2611147 RepID=UPI000A9ACBF0|nr:MULTISPECIES: hypothetical protein [unclassified Sphingobium]